MTEVPTYWAREAEVLRRAREERPVVASGPTELASGKFSEVTGDPVLMRALPRARFRTAFFEQVVLPFGHAECLENFEQGLRLAGLVGPDQILCQGDRLGFKFRVTHRKAADAAYPVDDGHDASPSPKRIRRPVSATSANSGMRNASEHRARPQGRRRRF